MVWFGMASGVFVAEPTTDQPVDGAPAMYGAQSASPVTIKLAAEYFHNVAWKTASEGALLSVVVPFFNSDVRPLAARLIALSTKAGVAVPLIFVDDGSPTQEFHRQLWPILEASHSPCQLAVLQRNAGRAKVRNFLSKLATTPYLLYLDADMWPDEEDFLQRYLDWIRDGHVDVIYGGRSARKVVLTGVDHELHRLMTVRREALPASVRRHSPAYHFYSCNFVVRRELLADFPLNEDFKGWGWEDCEWAARVAERCTIRHEDNSASHLGLLTPSQLMMKYDESVANFALVLRLRPELVKDTALFRVARLIRVARLAGAVRVAARWMAESEILPFSTRMRGLMFYKAALYAKVVGNDAH